MKQHILLLSLLGLLFLSTDVQAATSNPIQKDFKTEITKQSQKLIKLTKRFFKKTKSKVKKILDNNKENMVILGVLILLLLVTSLITLVVLKLTNMIAWSWAVVLIPLYILVLLFLYSWIPARPR